jgi:hypothetical protein
LFGNISEDVSYEAYVVGGLDGSKFSAKNGIRDGRIKERPSLNDPAFTGRVDWRPCDDVDLRVGVSGFFGGLNNANKGGKSGIDGDISLWSGDFEYSVGKFDFRGAIAHTDIDGAEQISSEVAEEMFGWYLEAGYHFWPEAWKTGKFSQTDAIVFVRYDDFDTQYKMQSGATKNGAGDRSEWTFGTTFKLTPNVALKADYQIRGDATGEKLNDAINLGIGFTF